jgi:Transposase domain (DUF772)/Transposase DDE domain
MMIILDHHRVLGSSSSDRELLDAAGLVGHLVRPGTVFAFLAEHRREVFPDSLFADLFPSGTGRPSLPADVIGSVMVLQRLHDLSDGETTEALRCDLRWKVACGLSLTYPGFDPSTLVYWRRRLAGSDRPHRVFDAIQAVIAQTGILRGKNKRVFDSTVMDDAVATQDTVTQLISMIRRVGREIPGAGQRIAAECVGDYSQPGKPKIDWSDPAARDALVSMLVTDANLVVAAFLDTTLTEEQAQTLALLALVAGQDVEPAEGSDGTDGRWRIARKVAADRVISTVDPDARHTRKTPQARRDGYRAHIGLEPTTGLVTDCELTKASGEDNTDPAVAIRMLATEPEPVEAYGDCAYATGELRAAAAKAGHITVIKPPPLRTAVPGGFSADDFTITDTEVVCPNNITRPIPKNGRIVFGAVCLTCPLQALCTTCKTGRILVLHPHHKLLRQARHDWRHDPALRQRYDQHRPHVERGIAHLATHGGRRLKLRYRGITKNNSWLHDRLASLNLRRLITLGLTRSGKAWVIA